MKISTNTLSTWIFVLYKHKLANIVVLPETLWFTVVYLFRYIYPNTNPVCRKCTNKLRIVDYDGGWNIYSNPKYYFCIYRLTYLLWDCIFVKWWYPLTDAIDIAATYYTSETIYHVRLQEGTEYSKPRAHLYFFNFTGIY